MMGDAAYETNRFQLTLYPSPALPAALSGCLRQTGNAA